MTDIEERAREALNEVCKERNISIWALEEDRQISCTIETVRRLLEREDALQERFDDYRQEVSDKVEYVLAARGVGMWYMVRDSLATLILPKHDPWVDACEAVLSRGYQSTHKKFADALEEEWAKRGGKIVWEGDDAS